MSASLSDFQAPFDPTAFTQITGGQLLQLIAAAQPFTDKGLVVVTADNNGVPLPPAAGTYTKWQNYLWLRIVPNTSAITLYAWNPNGQSNIAYSDGSGNTILSNWVPVISGAIPAASIQGSQIAASTIAPGNIQLSSLAAALGFNAGTAVTTATVPVGGIISGSFAAGFTIAAASLTQAMYVAASIDYTKLISSAVAGQILISSGTPATSPAWTTPPLIYTTAGIPVAANANKVLAVNNGASDYTLVTAQSLNNYLQHAFSAVTTTTALAGTTADSATLVYNTANMGAITSVTLATPTNPSHHLITIAGSVFIPISGYIWIYLYNAQSTAAPLAAIRMSNTSGASAMDASFCLKFRATIAAGTAITYYANYGGTSTGRVAAHGDTASLTVEEVI